MSPALIPKGCLWVFFTTISIPWSASFLVSENRWGGGESQLRYIHTTSEPFSGIGLFFLKSQLDSEELGILHLDFLVPATYSGVTFGLLGPIGTSDRLASLLSLWVMALSIPSLFVFENPMVAI